jgi:hypothetical protein
MEAKVEASIEMRLILQRDNILDTKINFFMFVVYHT